MGNVVQSLAFMPPDIEYRGDELRKSRKDNLKFIRKGSGKDESRIAALYFANDLNDLTILYSHGNAEDLAGSHGAFEQLAVVLDVNVLAFDYSGYGLSDGKPTEKGSFEDIRAALRWLTKDDDGPKTPRNQIILFGRSLGSGPTIDLAVEFRGLAGLILQSPLRSAIRTQMPNWVGSILSGIDIMQNEKKLHNLKKDNYLDFPALVIHGTVDMVVPCSHGRTIFAKLKERSSSSVDALWVDGCGHNNIEHREGKKFLETLRNFVEKRVRSLLRERTAGVSLNSDDRKKDEKRMKKSSMYSEITTRIDDYSSEEDEDASEDDEKKQDYH